MEREAALERTIKDPAFATGAKPGSQLFISVFNAYACLHVLDREQTLRFLQSQPLGENDSAGAAFPTEEWIQAGFQPQLIVDSPFVTLVPEALFNDKLKTAYAELNFGKLHGQTVNVNYLPQAEAYVLFTADLSGLSAYQQRNTDTPYHVATPWLASLLVQFHKTQTPVLCCDITDPLLRIAIVKAGELQFFNTFTINHTNDLLYYLASSAQANGLDLHKHAVYASGMLLKHSNRFQQLYRYIRYLHFQTRVPSLSYTPELDKVPEHLFYNLLGLPLCAS